jgi:hypothetical protein
VQLDAGPTITNQPPKSVEQKQKVIIAVVTKNSRGDEVHLGQTTSIGKLELESAPNGTYQLYYTAPPKIAANIIDTVTYTIKDEYVEVQAVATVQLDAGPTITKLVPRPVETARSTVLAKIRPSLSDNLLTVNQTSGSGAVTLLRCNPNGPWAVVYTAAVSELEMDNVTYTITDQYVSIFESANVPLVHTVLGMLHDFSDELCRVWKNELVDYTPKEFVDYASYDSPGNDVDRIKDLELADCKSACQERANCKVYTYDGWNKSCYLKSGLAKLALFPRVTTGVPKTMQPQYSDANKQFCEISGIFPGTQGSVSSTSAKECQDECDGKSACVAFTFDPSTNFCAFFKDPPAPSPGIGTSSIRQQIPCIKYRQ